MEMSFKLAPCKVRARGMNWGDTDIKETEDGGGSEAADSNIDVGKS